MIKTALNLLVLALLAGNAAAFDLEAVSAVDVRAALGGVVVEEGGCVGAAAARGERPRREGGALGRRGHGRDGRQRRRRGLATSAGVATGCERQRADGECSKPCIHLVAPCWIERHPG